MPKPSTRARSAPSRRPSTGGVPSSAGLGIVGLIAMVILIVVMSGGKKDSAPVQKVTAAPPELGWSTERVQAIAKWLRAVAAGDRMELAIASDLDALQKRYKLGEARLVSTMSGDDRTKLKDQVLDALLQNDDTKVLREFEPYTGALAEASMLTSGIGKAIVQMQPREAVRDQYVSDATIEVTFRMLDGKLVIDNFGVTAQPKAKRPDKPKAKLPQHDQITNAKIVERDVGGRKVKVLEADVVPLPHLADTPEALRTEIDRLIPELVRLDVTPRERSKTKARLKEIGKPAVPRLLTRFNDISAANADGIAQLTQIDALLRDLSGHAFGFSPAQNTALSSPEQNEDARQSALKQWYGWWWKYHDKPLDQNIDKEDETLFQKGKTKSGS